MMARPEAAFRTGATGRVLAPTTFSHPDYTVGPGITPDLLRPHTRLGSRAVPPIGNCRRTAPAHPAPKVCMDF